MRFAPDRRRAVAVRQVSADKTPPRLLVGVLQAEPLGSKPAGEVRDAAQVDVPALRRVAPVTQVAAVLRHMRPEHTVHQRSSRERRRGLVVHVSLPRAECPQATTVGLCAAPGGTPWLWDYQGAPRVPLPGAAAHNPRLCIVSPM